MRALGKGIGRVPPSVQFETHHVAPPSLQQSLCAGAVRVIGTGRIKHTLDAWLRGKVIRQPCSIRFRPVKAQVKRHQAALGQPAIERAGGHPRCDGKIVNGFGLSLVPCRDPTQRDIGMTGKQLGHRVQNHIRTQLKGAHAAWRGEGVVHHQQHTLVAAEIRYPLHIRNPQRRVRHHFDQHQPCVRAQRRGHGTHIGRIGQRGFDPKAGKVVAHHPQRPTI